MQQPLTFKQKVIKLMTTLALAIFAVYFGFKWKNKNKEDEVTKVVYFGWLDPSIKIKELYKGDFEGDTCTIYEINYKNQTYLLLKPKK